MNMSIRTDKRVEMLEKKLRRGTDETSLHQGNMDPLANNAINPAIIPVAAPVNMVFSPDRDYAFHGTLMIRSCRRLSQTPNSGSGGHWRDPTLWSS